MKALGWLRGGLRRQLVVSIALVHAVMMSVFVFDLVQRQQSMLQQRQLSEATLIARALARTASSWVLSRDLAGLQELVSLDAGAQSVRYAFVIDRAGQVLAHSDERRAGYFVIDMDAVLADEGLRTPRVLADTPALADVVVPVLADARLTGWVRVGVSDAQAQARQAAILRDGILYTLVAILLGVVLALWLARRVTRRLETMRQVAVAIQAGDLASRVPEEMARAPDETGVVAGAFNAMLDKLAQKQVHLQTLIETLPDKVWLKNREGVFLECNQALARMVGRTPDEVIGRTDFDLLPRQEAELVRRFDAVVMSTGTRSINEEWITHAGYKRPVCLETIKMPMRDRHGALIGVLGVARDITGRKEAEEALHLAASVFEASQEGILITDADNRILQVNPAFSRITGYSPADILGQNPRILASGRHDNAFYNRMWTELLAEGKWRGEIWNRSKTGGVYAEQLSITALRDAQGRVSHYIGVFSDISQLKAHEAELERIAHCDPLTGLPNRRMLSERLAEAMARSRRSKRPMAVVMLDLDGFKPVNDQLGHEAGDEVLKIVARRLLQSLRSGDTVARLGGDEFVLVMVDLESAERLPVALERILSAVAEPIRLDGGIVQVTASIGATLYPLDPADTDTLMRHADQSMYAAKDGGRNRYAIFTPEPPLPARVAVPS